jgi:alkylation response protein AidB-like acyl-CoA dehydrogenase
MSFSLTTEELESKKLAKEFREKEIEPRIKEIEKTQKSPRDFLKKLADVGMMGMYIPRKYGGGESSILAHLVMLEELTKSASGVEGLMASNNSIPEIIWHFGSEEIRQKYLPPICRGEVCASFMFTEPDTGSHPALIKTTALPDGDSYVINGTKRFITWGSWDGPAVVLAKDETKRISAFIVDKNVPGYTCDPPWELVAANGTETVDVHFDNVRIPKGNLIGEKSQGFEKILMPWICGEKIQQSARMIGVGDEALTESLNYAKTRIIRGGPQANLQGIQWMLAEMKTKIEASRWLTYKCASLWEEDSPDWQNMAALDKNFTIPAIIDVCRLGQQIHSAYGFTKEFRIEKLARIASSGLGVITSLEINKSIIGGSIIS